MSEGISRFSRRIAAGAVLLLAGCASDHPQTVTRPVSDVGRLQIDLWAIVTWWTVGIMVVVFGALAIILIRYRDRPDAPAPKPVYGSTGLELAWTVIPAVIILFIAVPTIQTIFKTQADPPENALVVEAIGHQWWWEFVYPELDVRTANEFYVPVGRPLELRLRSADVIHSFWVPRFGGKKDVNPVTRTPEGVEPLHLNTISLEIDSAGAYLGQCAEYCGTSHAIMRMMAVAVEPAEFDAWIEDMKTPVEPSGDRAARGLELFQGGPCIACHTVAGTRAAGMIGPNLTLFGERFSIGAGLLENTEANLTEWILHAPELKHGIIMPGAEVGAGGMAPTGLSREDAAAIAAYLSDLRRPLARGLTGVPPADTTNDTTLVAPAEPLPEITDTAAAGPR